MELDPSHTDAAVSLSVIYNDIGEYGSAKKIFEQANQRVKKKVDGVSFEDGHISKKFALKHHELGDPLTLIKGMMKLFLNIIKPSF